MWPFKQIKNWFFPPTYLEYRDSVDALVAYLPAGDLDALAAWCEKWVPYRSDTDTGKPDGIYDPLQNYNGADLTIKAKGGDCESIAAVYVEVIAQWHGWQSEHVYMAYADYTAHDVCYFQRPDGTTGWIDGQVWDGGYEDMYAFYKAEGWLITDWWVASDIGQEVRPL